MVASGGPPLVGCTDHGAVPCLGLRLRLEPPHSQRSFRTVSRRLRDAGKHLLARADKLAHRHSGFPGGLTSTPIGQLLEKRPERVVEKAIKGMLPHNTLGRQMASKLKVYAGPEHPHQAQSPVPYEITQVAQ